MNLDDWLSEEERARFTRRSNLAGAAVVAANWLLIALIFALVSIWTNPLTFLLGALLLGGRHMGLAVLMHEAGHQTLFRSALLNRVVGQWLCAHPVMADMEAYAVSHRQHHALAGTRQDPDLPNYDAYPVSKASFRRKLLRDLTGRTGWRSLQGILRGRGSDIMMRAEDAPSRIWQGLAANAVLLTVLAACGIPWLYFMWVLGYLVFYQLIARVRQVAEHGAVRHLYDPDARNYTRSISANPLERLLFCPNRVHYHVEHHLLASVPCYRLAALHSHLRSRGFYAGFEEALAPSYRQMLKRAVPALT